MASSSVFCFTVLLIIIVPAAPATSVTVGEAQFLYGFPWSNG